MLGYIDIAIVILEILSSIYNSNINDWYTLKDRSFILGLNIATPKLT